jgi:hypothetical protein
MIICKDNSVHLPLHLVPIQPWTDHLQRIMTSEGYASMVVSLDSTARHTLFMFSALVSFCCDRDSSRQIATLK